MEENRHVRKSNIFVEGRYRFGVNEQKILLAVISKIRIGDKEFAPYRITWQTLKALSKEWLDSTARIDEACQNLKNKTIKIREGRKHDNFGFLSGWEVMPGAWVEFRVDPSMRDLLLDLLESGRFTLYRLECILGLNSTYSIRLYEIMKSHQYKRGWVKVRLDDLKWSLGVPQTGAYDNFGKFKAQILEKSQDDLESHTDVKFEYRTVKSGRKVVALELKISANDFYQKTIRAAIIKREHAKEGDLIVYQGKEFLFKGGEIRDEDGKPIRVNTINKWLKEGKAIIK